MKKRILPLICLVVFCLTVFCSFRANAITPLDPAEEASLTLHYQKGENAFGDLEIGIYRVAQAFPDGSFGLIEPFAFYPVNIDEITMQEQWHHVAQTLWSYMVADQVQPDREEKTNAEGTVCFSGLETGLYFVREAVAENENGTYIFDQFMVYLPTPQPNGEYDYSVEATPKCREFIPRKHFTVTKLWKDAGKESSRPASVTVDIYKDGTLQETQILSPENNWSYTWSVPGDDYGQWTVAERNVPDAYKVTVQKNGNVFSIINSCKTQPDPPKTGETFSPLPWILILCGSGIALLILGIYGRRHKK